MEVTSTAVRPSTWIERPIAMNLGPFVGVDLNLRPIVQILDIEETPTINEYAHNAVAHYSILIQNVFINIKHTHTAQRGSCFNSYSPSSYDFYSSGTTGAYKQTFKIC